MAVAVPTSIKGILLFCARPVGHLYAGPSGAGILEQIDVGPLVGAPMRRLLAWGAEPVMYISISCELAGNIICPNPMTYRVATFSSPGLPAMLDTDL